MKYKIACFDLDGTIIDETTSIWQTIHEHLNTDLNERKEMTARFRRGEVSYEEWALHDIELWKKQGAKKEDIMKALAPLRLMKGARELLAELKKRGMKIALISGSLNIALEKVIPDYEKIFDYVHINLIFFDDEGNITGLKATDYDIESKANALKEICKKENFKTEEAIFIGDNYNDISAAKAAGLAVSFNSSVQELDDECGVIIKKKDLMEVLKHI